MTTPFKQFRFLDWKMYKDAQELFIDIKKHVDKLPRENEFDVGAQAIRSSLSVILTIAEGSSRTTRTEMSRCLDSALGFLYKTASAVDTLQKDGAGKPLSDNLIEKMGDIAKQLGGFKKSLSRSTKGKE